MTGLVPVIHVLGLRSPRKTWMAATSAAMTNCRFFPRRTRCR